jgi:hypothetical protein
MKLRRIASVLPTLFADSFLDDVPTAASRATAIKIKTCCALRNNILQVIWNSGPPVAVTMEADRDVSHLTGVSPSGRSKSNRRGYTASDC